ncbi:hypothetical protein [Hyphomonas sp.]|uniref:hypothetical protein n=1 Tax=Hyphomonas sp. TaxID=87 RepID=UPI0025B7F07C|nr:hypothetical protein [Hyphomonas sp.]
MARRRRYHSNTSKLSVEQARAEAEKPDLVRNLFQNLKLLDIKKSVIEANQKRLPFLYMGLFPILAIALFVSLWLAVLLGGAYVGTIWGPWGALERISAARKDVKDLTDRISRDLPSMDSKHCFAVFGVQKSGKVELKLSDVALPVDGPALSTLDTDGHFGGLGPYRKLGVVPLGPDNKIVPDLEAMKDQYWLGDARRAGIPDAAITTALNSLRVYDARQSA